MLPSPHIHLTGLKSLVVSEPSSSSESRLSNRTTPAAWYGFGRKMPAYRDNEREKWLHDPHSNTTDIASWKKKPHWAWLWYNMCEKQGWNSECRLTERKIKLVNSNKKLYQISSRTWMKNVISHTNTRMHARAHTHTHTHTHCPSASQTHLGQPIQQRKPHNQAFSYCSFFSTKLIPALLSLSHPSTAWLTINSIKM